VVGIPNVAPWAVLFRGLGIRIEQWRLLDLCGIVEGIVVMCRIYWG